uniref:Uncharacterized protein n=1 Tax=Corethron hystrix TaxID=216773 RepID=A0A7S1C0M4_9STRA|mmetsp:Transcript_7768/g.16868  ORF Transcript_7768/g.16868 Transcript_7768/m.16868 type:complete len:209 (+) Transcript_7768:583-1209(+)
MRHVARVDDVPVAMSPFPWVGNLYSFDKLREYADKIIWGEGRGKSHREAIGSEQANRSDDKMESETFGSGRFDEDLRAFKISCQARRSPITTGRNRPLLISGDSVPHALLRHRGSSDTLHGFPRPSMGRRKLRNIRARVLLLFRENVLLRLPLILRRVPRNTATRHRRVHRQGFPHGLLPPGAPRPGLLPLRPPTVSRNINIRTAARR